MRKSFLLVFVLSIIILTAGCNLPFGQDSSGGKEQSSTSSSSENQSGTGSSSDGQSSGADSSGAIQVSPMIYRSAIEKLSNDDMLKKTWVGYVPAAENSDDDYGKGKGGYEDFTLISAFKHKDGTIEINVDINSSVMIDAKTKQDATSYTENAVYAYSPDGYPISVQVGVSVVKIKEAPTGGYEYLSCDHSKNQNPARKYLEQRTSELRPYLEASKKIDTSAYDKKVLEHVYSKILSFRYIDSISDITEYDLENFVTELYFSEYVFGAGPVDASILKLTKNINYLEIAVPLKSYDVFENLQNLQTVSISGLTQNIADKIQPIKSQSISISGVNLQTLDASKFVCDWLYLVGSPGYIGEMINCESLSSLYVSEIEFGSANLAANFSFLNSLSIDYSMPVSLDLSWISGIENCDINISLYSQAVTPENIKSLKGAKLSTLNIMLSDKGAVGFDWTLLEGIDARAVSVSSW